MLKLFDFVSKLVWYSVVFTLVLLALYVSLGRYYMPLIGDYRQEVVDQLSDLNGLKFEFDGLRGEWQKFSPVVHIDQFTIIDAKDNGRALKIPELKISLDVIGSIQHREPRLKSLLLNAADLTFSQGEKGRWRLEGFPAGKTAEGDKGAASTADSLVNLLLNIGTLEIGNAHLAFNFSDGRMAELEALTIKLHNEGNFRRLTISTATKEEEAALLVVIEVDGDPRYRDKLQIKAYGKLHELDLTALTPMMASNLDLHKLKLNGELWLDWQGNSASIQGTLSSPEIDLRRKDGAPIWNVKNILGEFLAEKSGDGSWRAWIPEVKTAKRIALSSTYIESKKTDDGDVLQLQSEGLYLAPLLKPLLASDIFNAALRDTLDTLNPTGNLTDIFITLPLDSASSDKFQVKANLHDVSVDAWKGAPAAKNVNGYLQAGIKQGFVDLDTPKLSLSFPHVYKNWLEFDGAEGNVSWHVNEQNVVVESGLLKLKGKGDDGDARGQFSLDLPRNADDYLPLMSLEIGLSKTHARYRNRYIPSLLSDDLLLWLDESIKDGELPKVGFIFHGPLKAGGDKPSVQLFAEVNKARLKYHQGWPEITNADGLVVIDNQYSDIQLQSAQLFNSRVDAAEVHLLPHKQGGLQLEIKGKVSGDLGDGLRVIKESPIHDSLDFVDSWQAEGGMTALLDLSLPLGKGLSREPQVIVDVDLDGAALELTEQKLTFNNLKGPVLYDSKRGLRSKGLALKFWQQPARLTISSEEKIRAGKGGRAWHTELDLQGRASVNHLKAWTKQPVFEFFSGDTSFEAKVIIDPNQENHLKIVSNLAGVAIDLPEPYRKKEDSTLATHFRLALEGETRLMHLTLDDQFQLAFLNDQYRLLGGHISIGKESVRVDEIGLLSVTGDVTDMDLSQWLTVLERYLDVQRKWQKDVEGSDSLPLVVKDVNIESMLMFGRELKEVVVSVHHKSDYWRVDLDSDTLRGAVDVFDSDKPYRIELDYLHLDDLLFLEAVDNVAENEKVPQSTEDGLVASVEESDTSFHPRNIPATDFSVKNLYRQQEDYGSWSFQLRPLSDGVRVEKLIANFKSLHIDGQDGSSGALLEWRRLNETSEDASRFSGLVTAGNIGDVLDDWGYEKMMISESSAFYIDGSWFGDPSMLSVETIDGDMSLLLKNGDFINAPSSTSNALKVVGFLNLDKLIRRLQLDFSDLAAEGLSFDRIKGNVEIKDGILVTNKEIDVKSSSSEIRMAGRVDFVKETIDGEMVVILPLGSNLPWIAAALAGGLPAAASVYVASKVLKKQVDVLSSAVYRVNGGWDDPEIKFEKLFDSTPEAQEALPKGNASSSLLTDEPIINFASPTGEALHSTNEELGASPVVEETGEEISVTGPRGDPSISREDDASENSESRRDSVSQ